MILPPLISTDMCVTPFPSIFLCGVYDPAEAASNGNRRASLVPVRDLLEGVRGPEHGSLGEPPPRERERDREVVDEAARYARRREPETRPRRVERHQREPVRHPGAGQLDVVLADTGGGDRHRRGGEEVVAGE